MLVVCPHASEIQRKLPAQWEHLLNIIVHDDWKVTAVLTRSQQEPQMPFTGKHLLASTDALQKQHASGAQA